MTERTEWANSFLEMSLGPGLEMRIPEMVGFVEGYDNNNPRIPQQMPMGGCQMWPENMRRPQFWAAEEGRGGLRLALFTSGARAQARSRQPEHKSKYTNHHIMKIDEDVFETGTRTWETAILTVTQHVFNEPEILYHCGVE